MGSFNISRAVDDTLTYVVHTPKRKVSHAPIMLLLHGYGSNEQDLFSLAASFPDHFLLVAARAPHKMGGDSYAWYDISEINGSRTIDNQQATASAQKIEKLIRKLLRTYHADSTQVYLFGFSQGAIMSYAVGFQHPKFIRGIAAMSGRLLPQTMTLLSTLPKNFQAPEVFISHGTKDSRIGIEEARTAKKLLLQHNIQLSYHEYPADHTINDVMFQDMLQWLRTIAKK